MRTKSVVLLCLLGITAGPALLAQTPEAAASKAPTANVKVIEQIVAKVNNEIITLGELERTRAQLQTALKAQQVPAAQAQQILKESETNLLREKIDQLLLTQKAKDLSIEVDNEVSKQIATVQLESKITDPDKFQQLVREQTGMSFEDYKQQMKDEMMRQMVVRREVGSRINIPTSELKKYYDEHKDQFVREESVILREILVSTKDKDAAGIAAAEKKAKDLVARARKNENFGNLARDNSDADTARNYGELAPFKRGMLRKELEDQVFAQERGYVTDPIRTANGFLILRVDEHYAAGLQPFEAVQDEVMNRVYMPKLQPALREYLTKLRQDAFLEIRAGYVDSGAAPGKDTAWKDPAKLVPETVTKEEVAAQTRRRRLFWLIPIPGTSTGVNE
ncbi:MAG TPA: peptidylprolyl isomerase [Bryobacteraceae bacterium]|nr:peptidylprolyl isomerase [Bryobacteraceae bacterium]